MKKRNYSTSVSITFNCVIPPEGGALANFTIGDTEIAFNGLVWDRKCAGGSKLTFGDCIASQLDLTLVNRPLTPDEETEQGRTGRYFDVYHLEGAKVIPVITQSWEELRSTGWVQNNSTTRLGVFWVDNVPVMGNTFRLVCYDTFVKLDASLNAEQLTELFPAASVGTLIGSLNEILDGYGCQIAEPPEWTLNPQLKPKNLDNIPILRIDPSQTDFSIRDLIRWILELLGCVGEIRVAGSALRIYPVRYNSADLSYKSVNTSDIISLTVQSLDVDVTAVRMTAGDYTVQTGQTEAIGNDEPYPIEITDNGLWTWSDNETPGAIQTKLITLSGNISDFFFSSSALGAMTYRPMTLDVFNLPDINLGDTVQVANPRTANDVYVTLITGITYTLNGGTRLTSIGQSNVAEGWAAKPLLTVEQKAMMSRVFDYFKNFYRLVTGQELDVVDNKAISAMDDASSAVITAGNAQATANTAQNVANNAITAAGQAETTANAASTAATNAQTAATNAQTAATNYYNALIKLNTDQAGIFGLYATTDANNVHYWHDAQTLAGSKVVYEFSSNGMRWTTTYDQQSPVWEYGVTSNGFAVLQEVAAWNISATKITAGKLQSADGLTYFDLENNQLVINNANSSITLGSGALQTKITPSEAQIGNPLTMRTVDAGGATVASCNAVAIEAWNTNKIKESIGYDTKVEVLWLGKKYGDDSPAIAYQYTPQIGDFTNINSPLVVDGKLQVNDGATLYKRVDIANESGTNGELYVNGISAIAPGSVYNVSGLILGETSHPIRLMSTTYDVQIGNNKLHDWGTGYNTYAKNSTLGSTNITTRWIWRSYKTGAKEAWGHLTIPSWAVTASEYIVSNSHGLFVSSDILNVPMIAKKDVEGGSDTSNWISVIDHVSVEIIAQGTDNSVGGIRGEDHYFRQNGSTVNYSNLYVRLHNTRSATISNLVLSIRVVGGNI